MAAEKNVDLPTLGLPTMPACSFTAIAEWARSPAYILCDGIKPYEELEARMALEVLVLGGEVASVYAIHWLRKLDPVSRVELVADTEYPGYFRSLLPYVALGDLGIERCTLYPKSFLQDVLRTGLRAELDRVIVRGRVVETSKGEREFDKLLVATGVEAKKLALSNATPLERPEDALLLKERLERARTVGVVGGVYGLDVALSLAERGFRVSIYCDESTRLGTVFDEDMERIARELLSGYIKFRELDLHKLRLEDLVILRGFTRPKVPRVEGLRIGRLGGVVVDEFMRTSLRDVYAAGMVAEISGEFGITFTHLSDSLSMLQGLVAAFNVAGRRKRVGFRAPLFAVGSGDLLLASVGHTSSRLSSTGVDVVAVRHHFRAGDPIFEGPKGDLYVRMVAERKTGEIEGVQVVGRGGGMAEILLALFAIAHKSRVDDVLSTPSAYVPRVTRVVTPFLASCYGLWRKLCRAI